MLIRTATLVLALTAAPVLAQGSGHADHASPGAAGDSPAVQAYRAANDRMHAGMDLEFTGNPDVDFIRGMIAHHEGAVAMARVVLEHGSDPEVRKLAEGIIAAQDAEIRWMADWLARNAP